MLPMLCCFVLSFTSDSWWPYYSFWGLQEVQGVAYHYHLSRVPYFHGKTGNLILAFWIFVQHSLHCTQIQLSCGSLFPVHFLNIAQFRYCTEPWLEPLMHVTGQQTTRHLFCSEFANYTNCSCSSFPGWLSTESPRMSKLKTKGHMWLLPEITLVAIRFCPPVSSLNTQTIPEWLSP